MRVVNHSPLDIVITWVDGGDPAHRQARLQRACALEKEGKPVRFGSYHESLYRDFDQLRYLLRSLEQHAPWRGHIFLVTNGQLPAWLCPDHPDLSCVRHEEIFPVSSHLPTFNSRAIECHLHRIKGISEQFVYFNDDFSLLAMTEKSDLVTESGEVKLYLNPQRNSEACTAFCNKEYIVPIKASDALLNKHFGDKFRPMCCHTPYVIDKRVMEELQHTFAKEFTETSQAPFRTYQGIDPLHLYFNYLLDQKEHPLADGPMLYYGLSTDRHINRQVYEVVERYPPKFFCLNDEITDENLDDGIVSDVKVFYETLFPQRSSFERSDNGGSL